MPEPVGTHRQDGRDHLQRATSAAVALGVPPLALVASRVQWMSTGHPLDRPTLANELGTVPVADTDDESVPATMEVLLSGTIDTVDVAVPGPQADWTVGPEITVEIAVDDIRTREDPSSPSCRWGRRSPTTST